MDIQKERKAFQKFCEENFDFERHEQTYFDEQTQCYENDIGEDTESINMAWMAWKEVKTQEEKKLKLLLCDEHLQKCESPTGIFNTQYPDEEPCLICLQNQVKSQTAQEEEKTNAARVLCETACELLDGYAHQDAMVILDDLEQALK